MDNVWRAFIQFGMHADSWESCASSISSYLSALPTIQVHPELDERMLDIVHCFYNRQDSFHAEKSLLLH